MRLEEENLDPATERSNIRCFWAIKCLTYLSAPVLYVDIVQGAGELGTVYVSNYAISASPRERVTWNLALLELTSLFSIAGPALHGALTDAYGFKGSFALGLMTGILSLALISILPPRRSPRPAPQY